MPYSSESALNGITNYPHPGPVDPERKGLLEHQI